MISIVLIFFAAICNAIMDALKYRWNTSIFTTWPNQNWINPSLSWKNKWLSKTKIGDFLMSTIFVWVTDFWHFCKFLMLLFIIFAIVFYSPFIKWWLAILILYCTFTITFELFFSKILIKHINI
jgi:hypothetical protein